MKRLVIHGGIHRTGTTSIQKTLAENRARLLEQGCCYPGTGVHHQDRAWALHRGAMSGEQLAAELAQVEQPTVILSGEDFCIHKDLDWLDALKTRFDIEVHFFVRRQDQWLTSWYNQHLKWPFDRRKSMMSPMEFLATLDDYYWLDYAWLGKQWSSKLGRDKVHMYVSGGDNLGTFTAAIRPDLDLVSVPRQNDSVSFEALEVLRHIGFASFAPGARTRILHALHKAFEGRAMITEVYPWQVRQMVLSRFAASNRAAADLFMADRQVEDPFGEVAPDDKAWSPRLPESEELLRTIVGPLLKSLLPTPPGKR